MSLCHLVKYVMTEKCNQDGSINQNWLAEEITLREAGKIEMNIAQVKDVLNVTLDILAVLRQNEPEKFDGLLSKHIS